MKNEVQISNRQDVYSRITSQIIASLEKGVRPLVRTNGIAIDATIGQLSGQRPDIVSGFKTWALPSYTDQVLPFDITLAVHDK